MQIGNASSEDRSNAGINLEPLQADDDELAMVRSWVQNGKRPEFNAIAPEGYALKCLWSQFPCLELQDGLLVRRLENVDANSVVYQAIVPRKTRRIILNSCHDLKTSGHLGVSKTISKVKQKFYWPGVQTDVRSYVAGCETCSKRKGPIPRKRAPMKIVRSGYPFERIAIDILGELPQTANGYKYILVISDYFTKWTEALPLPNMEACTVAKVLVDEVLCRYGVPQTIHSDQGRQFESNLFQEMCKLFDIEKTRTTPYHPQSDGMVERFNRTLATMLTAYVSTNQRDWDDQLPYVMMAYRSSEHETTGMSPNMLMLGREVSTPLDLMFELPQLIKPIPNNQWVWELRDRIETAHNTVRKSTQQAMHRQKRIHDLRCSYETFEAGDQVFVYFPVRKIGTSAKLTPFWRGPYQITAKLSDLLYKINCGHNRTEQVIHCNRIRLCKQQLLRGETDHIDNEVSTDDDSSTDSIMNDDAGGTEEIVVPDANVEQTEHSDTRRVRKKPFWANDYVFRCSTMANTKKTPRKANPKAKTLVPPKFPKTIPKTICSFCLEPMNPGQKFEEHLIQCYNSRWPCATCGKTFKRETYLLKHKKKQHTSVQSGTALSVQSGTAKAPQKGSAVTSDKEESDWQSSPDISLGSSATSSSDSDESDIDGKEETQPDSRSADKEHVAEKKQFTASEKGSSGLNPEIVKGRIVRMPTKPGALVAPKKPRLEPQPGPSTENSSAELLSPISPERAGQTEDTKDQALEAETIEKVSAVKNFTITCSKKNGDKSCEQRTIIDEDGETIYEENVSKRRKKNDSVTLNLTDLIPEGKVATDDIGLCLSGEGSVVLTLKYRPDDE